MSDDSWRGTTRVIAYIDLALAIITACIVLCTVFIICAIRRNAQRVGQMEMDKRAYQILWASVLIGAVLVSINIWAIAELIQATAVDIGATEALKKSQIWFILTIVGMVLTIVNSLCVRDKKNSGSGILSFALRAYFLYVVVQYRNELKTQLKE